MSNTGGTWDTAKKDMSTSEHVPMILTLRANMLMTLFLPHAFYHLSKRRTSDVGFAMLLKMMATFFGIALFPFCGTSQQP